MAQKLTEQDGRRGLQDHLLEKAALAHAKHGAGIDAEVMLRILDDREIVRYPLGIRFDASELEPGEFAHVAQVGEHPRQGYCLFVHPDLEARRDLWPLVIAYYIPPVNYGDIADAEECELFGASLLGMDVEEYYQALCAIADALPTPARGSEGGHGPSTAPATERDP